jgi:hypothetical protein
MITRHAVAAQVDLSREAVVFEGEDEVTHAVDGVGTHRVALRLRIVGDDAEAVDRDVAAGFRKRGYMMPASAAEIGLRLGQPHRGRTRQSTRTHGAS